MRPQYLYHSAALSTRGAGYSGHRHSHYQPAPSTASAQTALPQHKCPSKAIKQATTTSGECIGLKQADNTLQGSAPGVPTGTSDSSSGPLHPSTEAKPQTQAQASTAWGCSEATVAAPTLTAAHAPSQPPRSLSPPDAICNARRPEGRQSTNILPIRSPAAALGC